MKIKSAILFGLLPFFCTAQELEIYISDAGNFNAPPWQILKVDQNGENPEAFITDSLAWPQDILFLEDQGVVLISNLSAGRITRHSISTGEYISDFATGIAGPTRFEIGDDGLLYVCQWNGDNPVLRYDLDGNFIDEFTDMGIPAGIGLDWDNVGNLYVSSYSGNFIRQFNPDGEDMGLFIDEGLQGPTNIWFDDEGNLFVLNWNGGFISQFDVDGNPLGTFIGSLNQPEGVDFMSSGDILIGNGGTAAVLQFSSDGELVDELVESGAGDLLQPNAVVIRDPSTLSINEEELSTTNEFLISNTGSKFYLKDGFMTFDTTTKVRVYDLTGRIVQEGSLNNNLLWDASAEQKTFYIIEIDNTEGKLLRSQVLVR